MSNNEWWHNPANDPIQNAINNAAASLQLLTNVGFLDSNGNTLLSISPIAAAVNNLNIGNSITGVSPTIGVAGTNNDIGINLTAKGEGTIAVTGPGGLTINSGNYLTLNNTANTFSASINASTCTEDDTYIWPPTYPNLLTSYLPTLLPYALLACSEYSPGFQAAGNLTWVGMSGTGYVVMSGLAVLPGSGPTIYAPTLNSIVTGAAPPPVLFTYQYPNAAAFQFSVNSQGPNYGIIDANANTILGFFPTAAATTWLFIGNGNAGQAPFIKAGAINGFGTQAVNLNIQGMDSVHQVGLVNIIGAGGLTAEAIELLNNDAIFDLNDNLILAFNPAPNSVNYFTIANAATGNAPTLAATPLPLGGDANIPINIAAWGNSPVNITSEGGLTLTNGNLNINAGGYLFLHNAAQTFFASLNASTCTANANYTMPHTLPAAQAFLASSNAGILSWNPVSVVSETGVANEILLSTVNAAPVWSTSTYPATNAVNTLLYASAVNEMAALPTADSGVLVTDAAGVPSISNTLPGHHVAGNLTINEGSLLILENAARTFDASITASTCIADAAYQWPVALPGVANAALNGSLLGCTNAGVMFWNNALLVNQVANGINYIIVTDATAGNGPTIGASGTDVNIPINITGIGTAGSINITGVGGLVVQNGNFTIQYGGYFFLYNAAQTYRASFNASTCTANADYTWPTTAPGAQAFLSSTAAGVMSWNTVSVIPSTATSNQILLSTVANAPVWSTSTYPATNAINTLLYASAANQMGALATANNGVLVTSATGVPSISSTLPAISLSGNLTIENGGYIFLYNSTETFYASLNASTCTSNANYTLPQAAPASTSYLNTTSAGVMSWAATIPVANGGTANTTFTEYTLLCAGTTATGAFQNVASVGSAGQHLASAGAAALPVWTTATYPSTTTINQILYSSAANTITGLATINNGILVTSATGVPSISTTLPAFSMTGNLTIENGGYIFLYNSAETFYASLNASTCTSNANYTLPVAAPASTSYLNTTSAGVMSWVATIPVANGGTANTTFTAYTLLCAGTTPTGAFQNVASVGSANQLLTSQGASALPTWTTATYPATTTINQILYSSAANTVTGLTTAVSSILVTNVSGVPSLTTTIPAHSVAGNLTINAGNDLILYNVAGTFYSSFTATGASSNANYILPTAGLPASTAYLNTTSGGAMSWVTTIPVANGGSGQASFTAYTLLCAGTTTTGAFQNVASVGSTNQLLTSAGASALPVWTTATYPATTTINQLLYSSAANTVTGLATVTTAVLTTSSGVPTWASQLSLTLGGANNSLVASAGGIVWSDSTKLNILSGTATANQVLLSGASVTPAWSTATYPASTTINQLLYSSAANTIGGLATGNSGVLVTSGTGVPSISTTLPAHSVAGNLTITGGNDLILYNTGGTFYSSFTAAGATSSGTYTLPTGGNPGALSYLSCSSGGTWSWVATILVGNGGTGATSFNTYGVVCGGATSTGALQSVVNPVGSGLVLTSGGAGFLPSWETVETFQENITQLTDTNIITPVVIIPQIEDSNNNNILTFTFVGSAVNYFNMSNAATGNPPIFNILSTHDSNVGMNITALGTGVISITGSGGLTLTSGNLVINNAHSLQLYNSGTTFYTGLQSAAVTANLTYTLPLAAPTVSAQILTCTTGGTMSWTTATYPATTTINQLLYSSAANTVTGITTANSGVLVTSGTGVPSISTTLPAVGAGSCTCTDPTTSSSASINTALSDVYNAISTATVYETVFSGINNASTFSVTYSASTRQFSVTTTAASKYTVGGIQYAPGAGTATTTAHATTSQLYYLYYGSGGTLTVSSTYWNLLTTAPVALVYYNNSNNGGAAAGVLQYEMHAGNPYGMTNATHLNLHTTRGTQLVSGCVASGYTLNTGGAANVNWGTTAGSIADEDIVWTVTAQATGGANTYRILWLTGTSGSPVWNWIDDAESGIYSNGTNIYYNQLNAGTWQLTAITANTRWVNYYIVATTAYNAPQIIVVMGQTLYTSLANAEAGTFATDCTNFGLFSTEGVVLYRVTYRRVGADGAPGNAEIGDFVQIIQNLIISALAAATQAANVSVDTASFTNFFSSSDSNVQQALNDLDAGVPFSLAHGGTNNGSLSASDGGIVWSDSTKLNILSGTATANQVLLSGASVTPAWSTATYPASTTINQLLYSSAANTIGGLATVNSAGLLTNASGVPGWVAYTGTGAPVLATNPQFANNIGVGGAASSVIGLNFVPTLASTTAANTLTLMYVSGTFTTSAAATGQTLFALKVYPNVNPNAGSIGNYYNIYSQAFIANSTTITNYYGGYFANPTFGTSPGTITNTIALYADNMAIGTGTVPPANGLIVGGPINIAGYTSLPASVSSYNLYLASGPGGGNTAVGKIYCGDGSGFSFKIAKRTSSTDTDWYTFNDNGTLNLSSTTNSSSTSTGSFITAGGAGIGQTCYVGNSLYVQGNIFGGNLASSPWYISSNGSDMFLNATNIYLRCAASNESISLGDTGGYQIRLYLPTIMEKGNTLYFYNAANTYYAAFTAGSAVTSSGTYTLPSGLPASTAYLTSSNTGVLAWQTTGGTGSGNIVYQTSPSLITPALGAASATSLTLTNALTVPYGGTGNTTFTAYTLLCAGTTATGTFQNVASVGSANQLLTSAGASALPVWTTATYPATTTINQLLYSSAANTVTGLATANSAGLLTDGSGVPSWVTVTGTGAPVLATNPQFTNYVGIGVAPTTTVGLWLLPTISSTTAGQYNAILYVSGFFELSAAATSNNCYGIRIFTEIDINAGSITNYCGISSEALITNSTTITNYYGGYFKNATLGTSPGTITNTVALYADNMAIGVTATTPPTSGLVVSGSTILTGGIVGTTTGVDPSTGNVGQEISSNIPYASPVSITSTNIKNMTSISLTAGNWLIYGNINFVNTGTNITSISCGIGTVSGAFPDASQTGFYTGPAILQMSLVCPFVRLNVSTTTTVYIVGTATFGAGTTNMNGGLYAIRIT